MKIAALWLAFLASLASGATVPVIRLNGPLNPGTGAYLRDGLNEAARLSAPYVILVLNTDGGLLPAARSAVQRVLESPVPVVAFVGSAGARAGSLGALLLVASDVAVMHPQALVGGEPLGVTEEYRAAHNRFEGETAELADHIARARARNAHGASKAIHGKEALTGEAALRESLIDFTAEDLAAVQARLVGFQLRVAKAGAAVLPTEVGPLNEVGPSLWQTFLAGVSDSRLAYGLFFLGFVLLALELSRPGAMFPGVLGGACVLFSLFLFYWLPISYGALAMMVVGFALILGEGLYPSYGLFGLLGLGGFILGSLWLVDTSAPDYQLPLGWVLACAATLAAVGFALSYGVFRGRKRRRASGLEALVGEFGQARGKVTPSQGKVFVQGEVWTAVCEASEEIAAGALVIVTGVRGLSLVVAPR